MIVPEHLDQYAVEGADSWHNSSHSRHFDEGFTVGDSDGCLDDGKQHRAVHIGLQLRYSLPTTEFLARHSIVIHFKLGP